MEYLLGQIVLCVAAAALLGVLIGWLLKGISFKSYANVTQAKWLRRMADVKQEFEQQALLQANEQSDIKDAVEQYKVRISTLEESVRDKSCALADAKSEAALIVNRLRTTESTLSHMQSENETLTVSASTANDAAKKAELARNEAEASAHEAQAQLGALKADSQHEIDVLKQALSDHDEMKSKTVQLEEQVASVQQQLSDESKRAKDAELQVSNLVKDRDTLQGQVVSKEEALAVLQQKVDDAVTAKTVYEERIDSLVTEKDQEIETLKQTLLEKTDVEGELERLEQQVTSQQQQLSDESARAKTAEERVSVLMADYDTLQKQATSSDDELVALKGKMSDVDKADSEALTSLKEQNETLVQEHEKVMNMLFSTQQELEESEAKVLQLESEQKPVVAEPVKDELSVEESPAYLALANERDTLKNTLADLQSNASDKQIAEPVEAMVPEEQYQALEGQCQQLLVMIENLQEQLATQQESKGSFTAEKVQLDDEHSAELPKIATRESEEALPEVTLNTKMPSDDAATVSDDLKIHTSEGDHKDGEDAILEQSTEKREESEPKRGLFSRLNPFK